MKTYVENNGVKSEVIKKFLTTNNLKYNLKFESKEIKVTTEEIITELGLLQGQQVRTSTLKERMHEDPEELARKRKEAA